VNCVEILEVARQAGQLSLSQLDSPGLPARESS
jgi:hypothetical protein